MRRSQPDNAISEETDDGSFQDESIGRRFPRVGAQFQTRISKSTGFTIRPAPERMSVDFPYISEKLAGELDQARANGSVEPKNTTAATLSGFDLRLNDSKSSRGGLRIHKPAEKVREFAEYVQPFVVSTRNQVRPSISNEAWIQHMIHLHSTETTGMRNRACRGGVKRKRAENEEMIWNLENILSNLQKKRNDIPVADMLGEEEATALEHFWLFFGGNIEAAEFNALVNLSGGQASKMRKCEERERTKKKLKVPSQQTSESWREMYESSTLPYVRTILGQLQDDSEPLYLMQTTTVRTLADKCDEQSSVNLVLEPDDSKGAWRSILACAKSIERQLTSEGLGPGDKKPLLSTLLTFVGKAYALPTPESCFGTHHVMIEEVSNTIISILNHVKKAQNVHARIRDKLFNESEGGINSDDLLKFLETEYNGLPIRLTEVDKLYRFRHVVVKWESRLHQVLSIPEEELEHTDTKNYLSIAEEMQYEARSHGYRSKALVQLTNRINKAYDLRDRILRWRCAGIHGKMTTIRTVSGFVKEAKRIKLFSPEVSEIFEYHRLAEEWIDRANIAIRSKISLSELKNLIRRGEEMTLDLTEYIDKLKTRVRIADDWLEALDEIVPFQSNACTNLEIWHTLETSLQNGNHSGLHDLSSEGNRIPVDVIAVKLLQLALDAKNWTTKALKWIPDNVDSKKGKLCDMREHLGKVTSLRDKLPLSETERKGWRPAGEYELAAIIVAADSWVEKYKIFLAGDNRKSDQRSCLSISKLRTIVEEGNAIYANIGNSISKISRILSQAENWYTSHLPLLQHCGVTSKVDVVENTKKTYITIQEMSVGVEAAKMDVSLDLDEAMELRKILHKSTSWRERVALIAPRRNKRHSRGSRSKFKLQDLIGLIEEASSLPIDTAESVHRLQIQLNDVETRRFEASKALENILVEFAGLKSHVEDVYGNAKDYSIERILDGCDSDEESVDDQPGSSRIRFNIDAENDEEQMDTTEDKDSDLVAVSMLGSQEDAPINNRGSNSALTVFRLIRELNEEARDISVVTLEGEMGELLDSVSKWCIKSFKYLNTPREVFDKRYFGAFDRFIVEGEDLCNVSSNNEFDFQSSDGLRDRLFGAWGSVVKDQLMRLSILKRERGKFEAWCKRASQILSDEKKLTAEKLADLAKSSRHFPANRDLVSKIRGLSVKVSKWTAKAQKLFDSGENIDMQDARVLVETGEKLKVQTEELKKLRAEIRAARNWSNRAKECNVDQGSININDVKQLIYEHDSLLIEMPDELEFLKQATIGYCICRRPYEGFMIGCDNCEEWYHGSCIGISESKADRFEKFICVRCSTKKGFDSSAVNAAGIVRKWTCPKDLKKARQIEFQKFQRKDRKEKKDIEKFSKQIESLDDQLSDLKRSDKRIEENITSVDAEPTNPPCMTSGPSSVELEKDDHVVQSDEPSADVLPVQNEESTDDMTDGNTDASQQLLTANVSQIREDKVPNSHEMEIMKGDAIKNGFCSSINDVSKTNTNGTKGVVISEADIVSKLEKAKASLQLSKDRLVKITNQSQQRTLEEAEEDKYSEALRHWCLKVRSEILAPSVEGQSEKSRPSSCGTMSSVMKDVVVEAEQLGIIDLPDVQKMVGCFQSICWSFSAMGVLRQKPSLSQVRHLVSEASKFKLPDEKALRTVKFMANKASQLQSKVEKALFSKKSTSKPNISLLKELHSGTRDCPLVVPEEEILRLVIDDGKLSDRELLESRVEELKRREPKSLKVKEDVSPHAPNPIGLWPPFGLHHSEAAIQAFGSECLAIPTINLSNTDATDQTSEGVRGLSSLPEPRKPEQTAVPLQSTDRNDEPRRLKDVSKECTKGDDGTQKEKLKIESSLLELESQSSHPRHQHIANPESCQHSANPSVTAALPSSVPSGKSEDQEKDDFTNADRAISIVEFNSTGQNQPESSPKDEAMLVDPSIPTDANASNGVLSDKSETQEEDDSTKVDRAISIVESNSTCQNQSKSSPKDEAMPVDPSNPADASSCVPSGKSEDQDKDDAINADRVISIVESTSTCQNQPESSPKDEAIPVDPSIPADTDASNRGCESRSNSPSKVETATSDPSLPSATPNNMCHSTLDSGTAYAANVTVLDTAMDTSSSVCLSDSANQRIEKAEPLSPVLTTSATNSQLDCHANTETEADDVRIGTGKLPNILRHSPLNPNSIDGTEEIVDPSIPSKTNVNWCPNKTECPPNDREHSSTNTDGSAAMAP